MLVGRYSRAITAIKDLLTAWSSMSYMQKASPTEIARLVLSGEAIINGERLVWQRMGIRKDTVVEGEDQEEYERYQDKHTEISSLQE